MFILSINQCYFWIDNLILYLHTKKNTQKSSNLCVLLTKNVLKSLNSTKTGIHNVPMVVKRSSCIPRDHMPSLSLSPRNQQPPTRLLKSCHLHMPCVRSCGSSATLASPSSLLRANLSLCHTLTKSLLRTRSVCAST